MHGRVVAALSDPGFYGPDVAEVKVIHTHASVVFLAGDRVYKIKRPIDLGFLDYSTCERREQMCRAEVELNRRLAADVYLGVVPITTRDGEFALAGGGEVVEWAVVMKRLPDAASWIAMRERNALDVVHVRAVACRLAEFHRTARRGPEISAWGAFEHVAQACTDNLTVLVQEMGDTDLVGRLHAETTRELEARRSLVDARAAAGVPCEIHGDLRLEHVYDLGAEARAEDLRIVDCVEFSAALRHGDPASDIAFLAMDLRMHGAWSLADALLASWLEHVDDPGAAELLPLYSSYRSAVRAKVRAIQARDALASPGEREHARTLARGHLVLAYGELLPAERRPCLVLVGGLPGTGKSRLAADLEARAGLVWIRADAVRKELAGLDPHASAKGEILGGLYTRAWNDRTYAECGARAEQILANGGRALIDASFKEDHRRAELVALARRLGVRVRILICQAPAAAIRDRLAERTNDPSDADWAVYEHAVATWEPTTDETQPFVSTIDTDLPHELTVEHALAQLRRDGLLAGAPGHHPTG